jgi:hypothetical protein
MGSVEFVSRNNFRSAEGEMLGQREHLIIGCGHGHGSCELSHPPSTFETIDMSSGRKPDVVLDVRHYERFTTQYQNREFASIILEGVNLGDDEAFLRTYLKDDGNFVRVDNFLFETIKSLKVGDLFYVIGGDVTGFRSVTIVPQGDQLVVDEGLQAYLNSITKNKKSQMHEIRLTEALRQRAEMLDAMHVEISKRAPYFPSDFILEALLIEPDKTPITAGRIRAMTETYSPGWLRRHTTGKTKGMFDLEDFLLNYPDAQVLEEQDLGPLLKLMQDRQRRVDNSLNPTRTADGSTTQVYKQITVAILNYWISTFVNILPELDAYLRADEGSENRP